jgi:hypothetical protein
MAAMATPDDKVTAQIKLASQLLTNVGFPIAVAWYFIVKIAPMLEAINATLARQQAVLDMMVRALEKLQ